MGKKKNNQNENGSEEAMNKNGTADSRPSKKFDFSVSSDVKRNVAGVLLFTLALLSTLGFFGYAGVVGDSLDHLIGQAIGWTKFIFPVFLVLAGIVLFFRQKTIFYVTKLIGLFVVFLSVTGLVHWFFAADKMEAAARQGKGGGYLGYFVAHMSIKYLGNAGSIVVILAMLLLGVIVAFELSIVDAINRFRKKKDDGTEELEQETDPEKQEVSEIPSEPLKDDAAEKKKEQEEAKLLAKENIGKIEFVEGPDKFDLPEPVEEEPVKDHFSHHSLDAEERGSARSKKGKAGSWIFPPVNILDKSSGSAKSGDTEQTSQLIQDALRNFGIEVERGEVKVGPSVTQYSFKPAIGVKISEILALQNDLALALASQIRIEAPIPGKSLIGIEVPNKSAFLVRLRSVLESDGFRNRESNLTIAVGQDVSGEFVFGALDKMPHLMVAGATGTGKSVCINSIIMALLYQNTPEDLKFIMVDPKRVELSLYSGIPHLATPVIVENAKVINTLKWAVAEMERRYKLFQEIGARDIASYKEKRRNGEKRKLVDSETGEMTEEDLNNVPYIVIIIDELADLMGSHGKEVEGAIARIAQMARAVGIHLIVSTQRPSVEVITGLIKANIATRISFQVASQVDSRTVLDMAGADKLLGNGDLLYVTAKTPKPQRIQGVFVTEKEVKDVVRFIRDKNKDSEWNDDSDEQAITSFNAPSARASEQGGAEVGEEGSDEQLCEAAKREIFQSKKASASFLQRRLRIGYARAARVLDMLEDKGVVGPADGAKPREIYGLPDGQQTDYNDDIADQEKRDKWPA